MPRQNLQPGNTQVRANVGKEPGDEWKMGVLPGHGNQTYLTFTVETPAGAHSAGAVGCPGCKYHFLLNPPEKVLEKLHAR